MARDGSRIEDRIRPHVLLCRLVPLLILIAESGTATNWTILREELQRLRLGTFTGPAGAFRPRAGHGPTLDKALAALFSQLNPDFR